MTKYLRTGAQRAAARLAAIIASQPKADGVHSARHARKHPARATGTLVSAPSAKLARRRVAAEFTRPKGSPGKHLTFVSCTDDLLHVEYMHATKGPRRLPYYEHRVNRFLGAHG